DFWNQALSVDASVYHIVWKKIQTQVYAPSGISYYENGNRAKSDGVELSVESRPLDGLTIDAWVAWNEAELTEDFPATSTASGSWGDRIADSSRWSGNVSVDQQFPVASMTGFVGASLTYVGERKAGFSPSAGVDQPTFPSYVRADLKAGLNFDAWSLSLFLN